MKTACTDRPVWPFLKGHSGWPVQQQGSCGLAESRDHETAETSQGQAARTGSQECPQGAAACGAGVVRGRGRRVLSNPLGARVRAVLTGRRFGLLREPLPLSCWPAWGRSCGGPER